MYILGISTMGESGAALLRDGLLVSAVAEERFTRAGHESGFPVQSIRFCLEEQGIALSDVDHIAVHWKPWRMGRRVGGALAGALTHPLGAGKAVRDSLSEPAPDAAPQERDGTWLALFRIREALRDAFGPFSAKIRFLDHHDCHIASGFFASPYEDAAILVVDGAGEAATTTLAAGQGTRIEALSRIRLPHSLGHFYAAMACYLGLARNGGTAEMMAMAAKGEPTHRDVLRSKILISDRPGSFRLDTSLLNYRDALAGRFSPDLMDALGPPRRAGDRRTTDHHLRIAASVQAAYEDVLFDLAAALHDKRPELRSLVLAGGCGLNAVANGRLLRNGPFERLFVPPAPNDVGCAIGAALLLWHRALGQPRDFVMNHAGYGPGYPKARLESALSGRGLSVQPAGSEDALTDRVAGWLADGKIVCWFQGRTEFAPHALGNRSILADPRRPADERQARSLGHGAIAVKAESASSLFELSQASPFAQIAAPLQTAGRDKLEAVSTIGSAQVQTVARADAPRFWALLDRFQRQSGVPALLNGSFCNGEPLVCTPEEAIEAYLRNGADILVLGDFTVERTAAQAAA